MVTSWHRLIDMLRRVPDDVEPELARLYAIGKIGYPLGFALHSLFIVIFWHLDLTVLALFNVASAVLWAVSSWLLFARRQFKWTFIACTLIEVPAHGVLATYYIGVESGFNLYILASVILVVLAPYFTYRMRYLSSVFYVVLFVTLGAFSLLFDPAVALPRPWIVFFFIVNGVSFGFMTGVFMALYVWIAAEAEAELVEEKLRTEAANRSLSAVSKQLAKYISPQLYQAIISGTQKVTVESRRKKLTVFFSDIVGFTEITDQLQSEELTALLNQYLTEMSKIAQEYGANFDKFIGDAIVLYFGDPETKGVKQDAADCVRMAIAMQRRMRVLQAEWREQGLERPFELRIGINTGYCTVGNFGSEDRMDYTIIGGEVNLAARLESHAETGGILLANETHSLVKDWLMAEKGEVITVKGFANPIRTFRVRGVYDELATEGRIIRHENEGLSLTIDREKLNKAEAITALESALAELKA